MKILIIRRSALGDTIHTLPLAGALREKYKDAQIDWIVEDKAAQFIVKNPLLNNVYVIHRKTGGIKEFFELIRKIRNERYDIAIDTQQLFKSGIILGLSGAKRKIALSDGREFSGIFANEIIKTDRKQFDIHYHVVKRNLEIAKYLGSDALKIDFVIPKISDKVKKKIDDMLKNTNKNLKTVVIAPETTWVNKHWSIEKWQKVVQYLRGKYNIVYTGVKRGLSNNILVNCSEKDVLNLCGQTNLEELSEILSRADLVISPDSGTAHIAWATGKSSVITLFFATSSERTAPFGTKYFAIQSKAKCSPCMKKKCCSENENHCIQNISADEVIDLIKKIL
jgi:lipopolysaccharide heptosyltransferase II